MQTRDQKREKLREILKKAMVEFCKERRAKPEDFLLIADYGEEVDDNQQAVDTLMSADLFKPIPNGRCYFVEGNRAHIEYYEEAHFFFYISVFPNGERAGVNISHFFIAMAGNNYGEGISLMLKTYNIKSKEEEVLQNYRDKYQENLEKIRSIEPLTRNPLARFRIEPLLPALEVFNILGRANTHKERFSVDGEHIFFVSIRYLTEITNKDADRETSRATIANNVNMLALLGFIEKVKDDKIPVELRREGRKLTKKTAKGTEEETEKREREITFYIIKRLTPETIKNAVERALQIKAIDKTPNGLKGKAITYWRVKRMFGDEEAEKIFPNEPAKREGATASREFWRAIKKAKKEIAGTIKFKEERKEDK